MSAALATEGLADGLRRVLGPAGVVVGRTDMLPYVTDWFGHVGESVVAVARPASTQEVSDVVRLCHEHRVAIVPQGGNTGLMGGTVSLPDRPSVLLSLGRMNRVLEVDAAGFTMTVEAGCILQTIREAADAHDRLFPLSLGAQGSCAIGGNIATNAGGAQVLRYGNTRQLVLGLEAVLPDGTVWDGLRALKKDNTGYDLRGLFIGSEGTLGVVTKAVLRLWPKAKDVATAWVAVPDLPAAVALLGAAQAESDDAVTSCELLHPLAVAGALRHIPGVQDPLPIGAPWYVLMVWSSSRPARGEGLTAALEAFLATMLEQGLVLDAAVAQSEAQERNMWRLRESQAEVGRHDGPVTSFDMSVATSRIPAFAERAAAAADALLPGVRPVPIGHIGDGNLHYNLKAPLGMGEAAFKAHVPALTRAVHQVILDCAGSISAEHGIGSTKRDELARTADAAGLAMMRAIKAALDPLGIMNPGKII